MRVPLGNRGAAVSGDGLRRSFRFVKAPQLTAVGTHSCTAPGGESIKYEAEQLIPLVQLGGLEPPTSCSTDRRSNQLSYNCILASRALWAP